MTGRRCPLVIAAGLGALCLVLVSALPVCRFLTDHQPQAAASPSLLDAVPGEVLVKFRDGVGAEAEMRVNQALGHEKPDTVEGLGVTRIALKDGVSPEEAASQYRMRPEVEYAEPNYILRSHAVPDDPLYKSRQQWYYDLLKAPQAWEKQTGDSAIVVAVLDTGIEPDHPDLAGAVWKNPTEIAGNRIDDDGNGCVDDVNGCAFAASTSASCSYDPAPNNDITDDTGHGSMVAGVVAATSGNQIGVAGAAPGVRIMAVKVLDCTGAGSTTAASEGIRYAARSGARVINISFGGRAESATLRKALEEAHDVYGVVIVASAGNGGDNEVEFPARYEKVIGVSAGDHKDPDGRAPFSSWGPEVDVSAPGVDIASTVPQRLCNEPWPCVAGAYSVASGTSFAAPLVSGAAALVLSRNPSLRPYDVANRLLSTAVDLPDGPCPEWDGAGRIQMDAALEAVSYRVGVAGVTKN